MSTKSSAPWNQPNPKKGSSTKLTEKSKTSAKAAAKRAGRKYPNMIDNMNAARKQKEEEEDAARSKDQE